jgi:hypothetical protein
MFEMSQGAAAHIPLEAIDKTRGNMSRVTFRTPGCSSFRNRNKRRIRVHD